MLQRCSEKLQPSSLQKAKDLGNKHSQPELIYCANLDYFLQVLTSYFVFIKLCREQEGREIGLNFTTNPSENDPCGKQLAEACSLGLLP